MRPARKRKLVDTLKVDWEVSIRRACSVLKVDRSLYVYESRRGEQAELKLKIKDICQTRVRYGYRRVHILIKREGWPVNPKRRSQDQGSDGRRHLLALLAGSRCSLQLQGGGCRSDGKLTVKAVLR